MNNETAVLSLLKSIGQVKSERKLFSLVYLSQKYFGLPTDINFCIDVFGINSNETRSILDELEGKGEIKITKSPELDPDLLVSKYNIYSARSISKPDEFGRYEKIAKKLSPLLKITCLPGIIYLSENTRNWEEAKEIGKKMGVAEKDILEGMKYMEQLITE